jgi:O-antigen ligase
VREKRWRRGALACSALASLALVATFTRGAWVGAAAGLVTMVALARPRAIPLLAGVLVLAVVLAPGDYRSRLFSIVNPADPTNRERTLMWEAGGRMFRDHPVTGVGLMDLKPLYERYRSADATERVGHLHSVPVQIAATMGSIGLAAFLALALGLLVCAFRGIRRSLRSGGLGAGVRLGVGAAIVAFLVAGLFEWNLGDEELLYPLFTLAGLAWAARDWPAEAKAASEGPPA